MKGFLALICVLLMLSPAANSQDNSAETTPDFDAIHQELLKDRDLQFDRPENPEAPAPDAEEDGYRSPFGGALNALGPLMQVLFWSLIVFLVGGLLALMGRSAFQARRTDQRDNGGAKAVTDNLRQDRPSMALAQARLEEADRLASEGHFAEAVHTLLFRSIDDIEAERKAGLASSLTAREISSLEGVSSAARKALSPINALVEKGIFGAKPLGASDYASAREAYTEFAFGGAG